ncbi:hypothetical protein HG471_000905 [Candidatus Saccharibacteria bacterium]|nr:hypothetical protein [Candidatus Saccharibacteria bacterium]
MNIDLLRELEGVVLDFYEKKKMMGVSFLTGVLGVLINLKPAALLINDRLNDSKLLDNKKIMEILNKLGVDLVRERLNKFSNEEIEYLYLAKTARECLELQKWHREFFNSVSETGEILDKKEWIEANYQIGKILGYPETATSEYIRMQIENVKKDNNYRFRMERNYYYMHSARYENEEFEAYDHRLNLAVNEYLPVTAQIMQANTKKRWLE